MVKCIQTDSASPDFLNLVKELDAELSIRNGEEHEFYTKFNKIDLIKHVIVAYEDVTPVGCGSIKQYDANTMEVKRMYVVPAKRGQGVAAIILKELENWALQLNYKKCILETVKQQQGAIALYKKSHFQIIPNYGQYKNVENSVCFEKILTAKTKSGN